MTKTEMRRKYRDLRKKINNKEEKDKKIYTNVLSNVRILKYDTFLFYYSTWEEVDTIPLIKYFLESHKKVALPRIEDHKISFYYIDSIKDVIKGKFGIWEPLGEKRVEQFSNSICFVPAICFDKQNYRIGYGGGYYDRFLKEYNGISIGLAYQECIVEEIIMDEFDQKVDDVITEMDSGSVV